MKKIYIYKINNSINNKIYIGQTVGFVKRTKQHVYGRNTRNNSVIDRAIQKHGKSSFEFSIIDCADCQEDADELERSYISKYNSLTPNGYNVVKGGRSQQGAWNQRKVYMYNLNGEFDREFESCSEVERLSNSFYRREGVTACCNGKAFRYKDKIFKYTKHNEIEPYVKSESSRKKKVYQFDKQGNLIKEFNSVVNASACTGTQKSSIFGCLKGNYKYANGYIWSYSKKCSIPIEGIRRIEIVQFDRDMNLIGTYISCSDAERKLELKKNAYKQIWKNLNKGKLVYGYYWYKKDNPVPSL